MLGTPSFMAKTMLIGDRVQNFRCRQPEGSGSSGKLRPKSITVITGPPSGFKTSPPVIVASGAEAGEFFATYGRVKREL
jgi:hypothetical protein